MQYSYPETSAASFGLPFQRDFHYNAEAISHTRNLTFLKEKIGGPWFDLEQIWDEHTYYEFENRSVEHTMSTMVQEPYVNHVPTVRPFLPLFSLCALKAMFLFGQGKTDILYYIGYSSLVESGARN